MSQAKRSRAGGLSLSSLNKQKAKVLRENLIRGADAHNLDQEYDASRKTQGTGSTSTPRVEVLPTVDIGGRLYDIGQGDDDAGSRFGNRRKKQKVISSLIAP